MALNFNTDNTLAYDLQTVNGSSTTRGAQAFAFDERANNLYVLENGAINRYKSNVGTNVSTFDRSLPVGTAIGHQGLAIEYLVEGIRLWATSSVVGRAAVRFSFIANATIDKGDVYTLFPSGTFANSTSCTPTVSNDRKYLIAHGTRYGTQIGVVRVFDLEKLTNKGPGDYSNDYLYEWETSGLTNAQNPLQGMCSDGKYVYMIAGGTGFDETVNKRLHVYTIRGAQVEVENNFTVGRDDALATPDATRYEPEGLSMMMDANKQLKLYSGILSGNPGARRFRIYKLNAFTNANGTNMSFSIKQTFIGFMQAYFEKVRSNIQPLLYEMDVSLAPNVAKTYDIKTLMTDHALYDLRSAKVTVQVLNTETGTALTNTYINSEAVAGVGITATGIVTILNTDVNANKYLIRIDKPTVKK